MRVLGVDPGTATTGFGLVEQESGKIRAVDYGCIRTSPDAPLPQRLHEVHARIQGIIRDFRPDVVAVEQVFFNKNARSALQVGQARGVVLLAANQTGLPVLEYTPLEVKMGVVGYGRASKRQIQSMIKVLLGLEDEPRPDDAADALAVALCCIHTETTLRELRQ